MNLEDHIGDIIRKARAMTQISAAEAAEAAGIPESEFAGLEASGHTNDKINFAALAPRIGLNAAKLEAVAKGWLPQPRDLAQWRELRAFSSTDTELSVNAYLVWDEVTRDAAVFDTGLDAKPVLECIAENQLQLSHIFITHSHYDHVDALPKFREAWPKARIHSGSRSAPVEQRIRANDFIMLGSLRVTNRATPGHAEDGTTYVVGNWPDDAPHVAIVGDAIFAGSIGRGNDSWELAKSKVQEQIFSLPAETLICPGHGPFTTAAEEKAHNPFF